MSRKRKLDDIKDQSVVHINNIEHCFIQYSNTDVLVVRKLYLKNK